MVVPPLVCQLFLAVPHCCKEVRVPQSSGPSEPPQVPEQPAPCQREKRLAKPLSPGILPASPPLRLETSSLSPSVPSSTHHPELALSGTRNFINPFPSQTRGTSACSLGTVDEGLNHRLQTREKREPASLEFAFVGHGLIVVFVCLFVLFCCFSHFFHDLPQPS